MRNLIILFVMVLVSITGCNESEESDFTNQVQKSLQGVVHIECPEWQGSGFIIDKHIIATARHVNEGVENFTITRNDGSIIEATRAISHKDYDVSFIWIKEELDNILSLSSIENCKLGESVYVIGSPYGKLNFNSLTTGIISGVNKNWDQLGEDYGWSVCFTVDSAGHPGNSGGPVFTMDGKVRGILVGGFSPVLVSVMPCDLFLSDLDEIELMFVQDKYYREENTNYSEPEYYVEDSLRNFGPTLEELGLCP